MDLRRRAIAHFSQNVFALIIVIGQTVNSDSSPHIVERWIGWTLRLGVWGSAGLMTVGLLLAWISPHAPVVPAENPRPGDVLNALLSGSADPVVLMFAGLLLLMLTPFLRVLTALVGFAAERDRLFVAVSLVVFSLLLGELIYSLR